MSFKINPDLTGEMKLIYQGNGVEVSVAEHSRLSIGKIRCLSEEVRDQVISQVTELRKKVDSGSVPSIEFVDIMADTADDLTFLAKVPDANYQTLEALDPELRQKVWAELSAHPLFSAGMTMADFRIEPKRMKVFLLAVDKVKIDE